MQRAREAGARRAIVLPVSVAAHSPLMADAAQTIEALLGQIDVRRPRTPVLSNVTARPVGDEGDVRRDIVQQLTSPVRWTETIQHMAGLGAKAFVEVGPGNVLVGLVQRILPDPVAWSLSDVDGISRLVGQPISQ